MNKCKLCDGTGLIEVAGKLNTFKQCECTKNKILTDRFFKSGLSIDAAKKTFKTFNVIDNETKDMKDTATGYVIKYKELIKRQNENNSIALLGQSGSGKSHLLSAIANNLIKQSIDMQYISYPEEMNRLKQVIMDEIKFNNKMNRFKKCSLLIIDDLFKNGCTDSDVRLIFEIINYRATNNKPVAISSELTILDLCKIDEALGSRIKFMTESYRYEIVGKQHNFRMR